MMFSSEKKLASKAKAGEAAARYKGNAALATPKPCSIPRGRSLSCTSCASLSPTCCGTVSVGFATALGLSTGRGVGRARPRTLHLVLRENAPRIAVKVASIFACPAWIQLRDTHLCGRTSASLVVSAAEAERLDRSVDCSPYGPSRSFEGDLCGLCPPGARCLRTGFGEWTVGRTDPGSIGRPRPIKPLGLSNYSPPMEGEGPSHTPLRHRSQHRDNDQLLVTKLGDTGAHSKRIDSGLGSTRSTRVSTFDESSSVAAEARVKARSRRRKRTLGAWISRPERGRERHATTTAVLARERVVDAEARSQEDVAVRHGICPHVHPLHESGAGHHRCVRTTIA